MLKIVCTSGRWWRQVVTVIDSDVHLVVLKSPARQVRRWGNQGAQILLQAIGLLGCFDETQRGILCLHWSLILKVFFKNRKIMKIIKSPSKVKQRVKIRIDARVVFTRLICTGSEQSKGCPYAPLFYVQYSWFHQVKWSGESVEEIGGSWND